MEMKIFNRTVESNLGEIIDTVSLVGYNSNGKQIKIEISGPQMFPYSQNIYPTFDMELKFRYIPIEKPITLSIK